MQSTVFRSRWIGQALYGGGALIIALAWLYSSAPLFTTGFGGALIAVGRICGLLAVYCFLWQLLMMSRVPLLEQSFGLDGLTRLHRLNGYAGFSLLIVHPPILALGYALPEGINPLTQYYTFITSFEDVWKAFISYIFFWIVVLSSIYIVRKRLKFETWYAVHLLTYIAILLAFGHQLSVGGDFLANASWRYIWTGFYAATFGVLLWFRVVVPAWQSFRQGFLVDEVVAESATVTSVYIRLKHPSRFRYTPGQFVIVRFLTAGRWYQAHPFSLSMVPKDDRLRMTIRHSGDFTTKIVDLSAGAKVYLEGPYGIFTPALSVTGKNLYIAGGVGITPIRAMLELASQDSVLIYSSRTAADLLFTDELQRLAAQREIKIIPVVTGEPEYAGEHDAVSPEALKRLVPDVATRDVFVCGPPPMMDAVEASLKKLGVPKEHIHDERFSFAGPPTKSRDVAKLAPAKA